MYMCVLCFICSYLRLTYIILLWPNTQLQSQIIENLQRWSPSDNSKSGFDHLHESHLPSLQSMSMNDESKKPDQDLTCQHCEQIDYKKHKQMDSNGGADEDLAGLVRWWDAESKSVGDRGGDCGAEQVREDRGEERLLLVPKPQGQREAEAEAEQEAQLSTGW